MVYEDHWWRSLWGFILTLFLRPGWNMVESRGWNLVWGNVSVCSLWFMKTVKRFYGSEVLIWLTVSLFMRRRIKPSGELDGNCCCLESSSFHQMPVNSQWTQTQFTETWNCLTTTGRWRQWPRSRSTRHMKTGLTSGNSCCVVLVWLVAATGRWSGEGWFIYPWLTEESKGKDTLLTAGLDATISPGLWGALMLMITLPITIREEQTCICPTLPPPPLPPLSLTE